MKYTSDLDLFKSVHEAMSEFHDVHIRYTLNGILMTLYDISSIEQNVEYVLVVDFIEIMSLKIESNKPPESIEENLSNDLVKKSTRD